MKTLQDAITAAEVAVQGLAAADSVLQQKSDAVDAAQQKLNNTQSDRATAQTDDDLAASAFNQSMDDLAAAAVAAKRQRPGATS